MARPARRMRRGRSSVDRGALIGWPSLGWQSGPDHTRSISRSLRRVVVEPSEGGPSVTKRGIQLGVRDRLLRHLPTVAALLPRPRSIMRVLTEQDEPGFLAVDGEGAGLLDAPRRPRPGRRPPLARPVRPERSTVRLSCYADRVGERWPHRALGRRLAVGPATSALGRAGCYGGPAGSGMLRQVSRRDRVPVPAGAGGAARSTRRWPPPGAQAWRVAGVEPRPPGRRARPSLGEVLLLGRAAVVGQQAS